MDPDKRAEFINKVKEQVKLRQGEITIYHALNKSFELREVFRLSEETASHANRFFNDKVIPWYCKLKTTSRKLPNKELQFQILVAHLAFTYSTRPLRLSLNRNNYTKYRRLSAFVIDLVKFLEEFEYIYVLKGVNLQHAKYLTRIGPTKKLRDELLSQLIVRNDPETKLGGKLVQLKGKLKEPGSDKYKEVGYQESKFTRQLTERIRKINLCNSRHRVAEYRNGHEEIVITDLHAVFNRSSFDCGGRLYNGIFGYQYLPQYARQQLLIDGHKTVELDFSAFHPRLLYALKGINYTADPYTAVTKDKQLRKILKKLLLAIFNSADELIAIRAGNYSLKDEHELREQLQTSGSTVTQLIEMFKTAHAPISDYFFSNKGLHLMRLDSEIAINVLEHFTDKREACLGVHDSFVVEERLGDELEETMKYFYGKITEKYSPDHRVYTCKIDRK